MSDDVELVLADRHGSTGIVRLNRPKKHNALSHGLLRSIGSCLTEFEQDQQIRAVVITGSDVAFSTGADLNEALEANTPTQALRYAAVFRSLGQTIERSPLPIIAAIEGWCITGGMELALMCDIRIASSSAVFGITSARIGSVAGAGGTQRLPRLIGAARAKELLFTSEYIDAEEASRIGLVNRVVEKTKAFEESIKIAERIARHGPLSIGWLKSAVDVGMNMDLESALSLEAHLVASAYMTEDRAEGMKAFLEKREAKFKGR